MGGGVPFLRNRRTFEYAAVSTSAENVERGESFVRRNALATIGA